MQPDQINSLLHKLSEILETTVHQEDSMDSIAAWDSLNTIHIVMMLKSDYNLDIAAEEIVTLRSVTEIMRRLDA